jgi:hypothetical protein
MNNNKNTILAILGLITITVLVYGIWSAVVKTAPQTGDVTGEGVVCTLDAMQCPDGSWIGRSGPRCQFVCPKGAGTPAATATVEVGLNQKITPLAESITVLDVIEDSRCPLDVQCIQAGTVRVRVRIEGGMGTATETFPLNGTITTETEAMTLIAVKPQKVSVGDIPDNQYRFVFAVSKR